MGSSQWIIGCGFISMGSKHHIKNNWNQYSPAEDNHGNVLVIDGQTDCPFPFDSFLTNSAMLLSVASRLVLQVSISNGLENNIVNPLEFSISPLKQILIIMQNCGSCLQAYMGARLLWKYVNSASTKSPLKPRRGESSVQYSCKNLCLQCFCPPYSK